ncbi:unnamed protein product [Dicrocoelium dendriticum]|nr:unnamed protein product [Dicrocoelium dendriticum]
MKSYSESSRSTTHDIVVCVHFLDSSSERFHLSVLALGQDLYNLVVEHLKLVEYDYFDLEYINKDGHTFWLDHMKPLRKQHTVHKDYVYTFAVKFYTPHPNLMEDEFTRCLFALQIRKDLQSGRLTCSENTAALLSAFIVQSHIGDFLEDIYLNHSYLSSFQLLPTTTTNFLKKVAMCHRSVLGQSPADADYNLLDTVRKVELYGTRMHPARDSTGNNVHLSVTHAGILVYQRQSKVNTFSWARIRKLSFKRKRFILKLHSERLQTVEFLFDSRDECKSFWKQCIEHHAFFRCQAVRQTNQRRGLMLTKGSSFRYTGRTQKQLLDYVRDNYVKLSHFERSPSVNRVLTAPVPGTLLRELMATQVSSASGPRSNAEAHSDYGPATSYRSQARPQTDPAQRTHLTDSCLSCPSTRPFAIAAPILQQQTEHSSRKTLRQVRRGSLANEAALPNTLPRASHLLSAMGGTASSGSYTMNSSVSAGSPAASNSPVSSPQPDKKVSLPSTDCPTQFVLTNQLELQHLSFQPLSSAQVGPAIAPLVSSNLRASLQKSVSPTQAGVVYARLPGSAYQRTLGMAVLPTNPGMHTSLLFPSQTPNVSHLRCGVPVVAFETSASGLASTAVVPITTVQSAAVRLPTQSGTAVGEVTGVMSQAARFRVPPGYAVLARTTELGTLSNQVIYLDPNTGKPLLPVFPSGGQRLLDSHQTKGIQMPGTHVVKCSPVSTSTQDIAATQPSVNRPHSPVVDKTPAIGELVTRSSEERPANGSELRSKPYRLAPPAPERRDSKLCSLQSAPTDRCSLDAYQQSSSKPFACDWSQKADNINLIDSGAENDDLGSPQSLHPLATGLITGPNGLHSVSCLSLATRSALSARNLCTNARDDSENNSRASTPELNCFGTPGGCQSDTERSSHRLGHSSHSDRDLDEAGDQYSPFGPRNRGRSRSASCRYSHRPHHHRQRVRHPRCHSAIDPSMSVSEGNDQRIAASASESPGIIPSVAQHHIPTSVQRAILLPGDAAYHIISDLVMTERTYGRNLSVVCVCFRHTVTWLDEDPPTNRTNVRLPDDLANNLFNLLDPIYSEHQKVLASFEARLVAWNGVGNSEGGTVPRHATGESSVSSEMSSVGGRQPPTHRVGDIFLAHVNMLLYYQKFITEVEQLILLLEKAMRSEPQLEVTLRRFEAQKFCYLPLYVFLLKPMHRLLQYRVVLERLMRQYGEAHADGPDCRAFHSRLLDLIQSQWDSYRKAENTYKLLEIQRDLCGLMPFPIQSPDEQHSQGKLAHPAGPLFRIGRQFIREGWLQKLTKKGYQPRIFFLFSDQLIYASRTTTTVPQFRVHGQFPLYDLMVEEAEPAHSFTVFSGNRCFLVAAPSDWQRDRWLEDISRAILAAKTRPSPKMDMARSVYGVVLDAKSDALHCALPGGLSDTLQRATTAAHVCWHRCYTYSMQDILRANELA